MAEKMEKLTLREELIAYEVLRGMSFADIGRQLGISRERVRQLYDRIPDAFKPSTDNLLSARQLGDKLGYTKTGITELAHEGKISGVKMVAGGKYGWWFSPDAEIDRGTCKVCGKPIPKYRFVYCGDDCYKESVRRYFRLGFEQKACKNCGKIIPKGRAFHCGDECYIEYSRLLQAKRYWERKEQQFCQICGKPVPKWRRIFCNDECLRVGNNIRMKERYYRKKLERVI